MPPTCAQLTRGDRYLERRSDTTRTIFRSTSLSGPPTASWGCFECQNLSLAVQQESASRFVINASESAGLPCVFLPAAARVALGSAQFCPARKEQLDLYVRISSSQDSAPGAGSAAASAAQNRGGQPDQSLATGDLSRAHSSFARVGTRYSLRNGPGPHTPNARRRDR
jgi:hypothetical protein